MPPEAEQAPEVQDTPAEPAAPEEGHAAPESKEDSPPAVDYQKRYDDLVPEYTRGQQLIAAARGDHGPEAQVQALQQLGVTVQQAEEEAKDDDPFEDPYESRIEKLEQKLASKEEQEEVAQFQKLEREYIDSTIGELESKENIKLTDKEKRFVKSDGLANRLEDGRPDLQSAFNEVIAYRKETLAGHVASKKAAQAPVGAAGEEKIDFSDPEQKRKYMAEQFEAALADEGS